MATGGHRDAQEAERLRQSREALERVARDSETLGTSSMARTSERLKGHFLGQDAIGQREDGGTDPVELWGRRIGRVLSAIGVVVMTYWLGLTLNWW